MPAHSPLATKDRLPATLREVGSRTVVAMTQPRPFLRRAYTTVGGLLRAALVVVGTPEALVTIALPIGLHGVGGAHASNFELAAIPLLALVVIGVLSPRSAPRLTRSMGARPVPREALPSDVIRVLHTFERSRPRQLAVVVLPDPHPSAFVLGTHVLGFTTTLLRWQHSRRLSDREVAALVQHEIGHLLSPSRWMLVGWVVAWPAAALTDLLVECLPRRLGLGYRQMIVLGGLCIATLAAISAHFAVWWLAAPLGLSGLALVLGRARTLRSAEFTADRYAAHMGAGPDLASALRTILYQTPPRRVSVFDTHPPLRARIDRVRAQEDGASAQ